MTYPPIRSSACKVSCAVYRIERKVRVSTYQPVRVYRCEWHAWDLLMQHTCIDRVSALRCADCGELGRGKRREQQTPSVR